MADDIVTRLRSFDVGRVSTHYHDCWKSHTVCALRYAADEIERLRAAGDVLHAAIRNHDPREEHLRVWEEARRG